jgi:hypothetical protein
MKKITHTQFIKSGEDCPTALERIPMENFWRKSGKTPASEQEQN